MYIIYVFALWRSQNFISPGNSLFDAVFCLLVINEQYKAKVGDCECCQIASYGLEKVRLLKLEAKLSSKGMKAV